MVSPQPSQYVPSGSRSAQPNSTQWLNSGSVRQSSGGHAQYTNSLPKVSS